MINQYEVGYYGGSNSYMKIYIDEVGNFFLFSDDDQDSLYIFNGDMFIKVCTVIDYKYFNIIPNEMKGRVRPATRSELKAASLWDLVINKDDYSCPEDELEEYLKIAEETDKKK